MKRLLTAALLALTLAVPTAALVAADAPPPTNGGNGAGHSGQCSGTPDSRPAVCPAS